MHAHGTADPEPVTLDNCDREPIHIPGAIQSHGALFAFGADGRLHWVSQGAAEVLGARVPALGETVHDRHFDGSGLVRAAVDVAQARGTHGAGLVNRHEVDRKSTRLNSSH